MKLGDKHNYHQTFFEVITRGLLKIFKNEDKKSLLKNGNKHLEKSEFDKALKSFDKILELDPESVDAIFYKGVIFRKTNKSDDALKCFNNVLELDPKYIGAWTEKGAILGLMSKYQEALNCLDTALKLDSANVGAWYVKGLLFGSSQNVQEALNCFDNALKLNPDFEPAKESKKLLKTINRIP